MATRSVDAKPWSGSVGPISGPPVFPGKKEMTYRNSTGNLTQPTFTTGPGKKAEFKPGGAPISNPITVTNPAALKRAAARKFKLTEAKRTAKTMKLGENALQEGRAANALRKRKATTAGTKSFVRKKAPTGQTMPAPVSRSAAVRRLANVKNF